MTALDLLLGTGVALAAMAVANFCGYRLGEKDGYTKGWQAAWDEAWDEIKSQQEELHPRDDRGRFVKR